MSAPRASGRMSTRDLRCQQLLEATEHRQRMVEVQEGVHAERPPEVDQPNASRCGLVLDDRDHAIRYRRPMKLPDAILLEDRILRHEHDERTPSLGEAIQQDAQYTDGS